MTDQVDEAVRRAAPPPLGADRATAELAEAVARTVVAAETRERVRLSRLRRFIGGSALGIGILGVGVTGAAMAGPAVLEWVGWSADVTAQRSFDLGDGSDLGLCEVFIRVLPEYHDVSEDEADRRTEAARRFLAEHDWDPVIESITGNDIETAFEAEAARRAAIATDSVTPPPATLSGAATGLMFARVAEEFEQAGHLRQGVSLEAAAGPCGATTEGPTQ